MEVTRRTATRGLGLTPLAGVVAGCGAAPERPGRRAGDPGDAEDAADAADLALVRDAWAEERAVLELCRRAGRRRDAPAGLLEGTAGSHQRHVQLLGEALPERPRDQAPLRLPADPRRAVRAVVAAERELARAHVRRSMTARSGPLARLLAAMAAAGLQQAETLAAREAPRGRGAR